jgi:hypothetical protein
MAERAGAWETAADYYAVAQKLKPIEDYSVQICYLYSLAGKKLKAEKWIKIAYNKNKTACTCYNLSTIEQNEERIISLLREALSYDPSNLYALINLGIHLTTRNPGESKLYKKEFVNIASKNIREINNIYILDNLDKISTELGMNDIAVITKHRLMELKSENAKSRDEAYIEDNLAARSNTFLQLPLSKSGE